MPDLIRAEYLICDPDLLEASVITDGALVIDAGKVIAAGPWAELRTDYSHLTPLGGPRDWLVIPGLINAHHHGRGIATESVGMQDAPLELWLPGFMLYPNFDTYWNTLYTAARMLRSGITASVQSHSSTGPFPAYRESVERALAAYHDAGVRVSFALGHHDQNVMAAYVSDEEFLGSLPLALQVEARHWFHYPDIYISTDQYFTLFEELWHRCKQAYPRARLLFSPVGLQWASDALLSRLAAAARDYATGVHLHLLETKYQCTYVYRRFGCTAVEVLQKFDLLGPGTSLAHAIWLAEHELSSLAAAGATVVTNTSSNLRLGSGLLPLSALRTHGVKVALGLDSTSLFDDEDMLKEMRLVSTLHRRPGLERDWPSSYEVLRMATVGGAGVALLAGEAGKLLPGYNADITVLRLDRIRRPYVDPAVDPVGFALGRAVRADVDTVLVGGEVLVRNGELTRLDLARIEAELGNPQNDEHANRARRRLLRDLQPHIHTLYERWVPERLEPYYPSNSRISYHKERHHGH
ncbi:MAG: amidohydrolase family protein [Ardenticatenaceae bacterium]|nr:amidohydrolase family protein [Ardenticatenaceae bacterium]